MPPIWRPTSRHFPRRPWLPLHVQPSLALPSRAWQCRSGAVVTDARKAAFPGVAVGWSAGLQNAMCDAWAGGKMVQTVRLRDTQVALGVAYLLVAAVALV